LLQESFVAAGAVVEALKQPLERSDEDVAIETKLK
jgi:hypothetical protein